MNKNLKENLSQLDLSDRQADIYVALLGHGSAGIAVLERELQLHKQQIYVELERLIARGLVSVMTKNNRKVFHAADPEVFVTEQEERQRVVEQTIPALHALAGVKEGLSDITTYEGNRGVLAFHRAQTKKQPTNSSISILGAGGQQVVRISKATNLLPIYDIIRERRNISQRLLMHDEQRGTCPNYVSSSRFKNEVRYLHYPSVNAMATQIWFDTVAFVLFLEKPKIVAIKSPQAVQTFQTYFDILWEQGKA